jgi:hypothetical protein
MHLQHSFSASSPEQAATRYVELLVEELRRAKPSSLQTDGRRISLRAGVFRLVSNWNLLVSVTSAEVSVTTQGSLVQVDFDARLTELVLFCVLATVFLGGNLRAHAAPIEMHFVVLAMVWIWAFGMNVFIARMRLKALLRRVAEQATARVF